MGHNKSHSKKEVYGNTILPQETRKIPNKQPNLITDWFQTGKGVRQGCILSPCLFYNPLQYSCLESSMDGGAMVHGVTKSWT